MVFVISFNVRPLRNGRSVDPTGYDNTGYDPRQEKAVTTADWIYDPK